MEVDEPEPFRTARVPEDWLKERNAQFPDGSILAIIYHNFLTYDDAIVRPGANLNLIIGTNGSGKSSIICGICLAVGGCPKILGRSERIGDYIKNGRKSGSVELKIADSAKGVQSLFVHLQQPNSSQYFINRRPCPKKEVEEFAAQYNIQIDNPCTFLAQDKVKSFSEQSPVDLLYNTEKAGDPRLLEMHKELLERRKHESTLDDDFKDTEKRMSTVKDKLEAIRPRVEAFRTRQSLMSKLRALDQKRTVLEYQDAREEFETLQGNVKKAKEEALAAEEAYNSHRRTIESIMQKTEKCRQEVDEIEKSIEKTKQILLTRDFQHYRKKTQNARDQFEIVKCQVESFEKDIEKLRNDIQNAEAEVARSNSQNYEEQFNQLKLQHEALRPENDLLYVKENRLVKEKENLKKGKEDLRRYYASVKSAFDERLEVFRNIGTRAANNAEEAWVWYQRNKAQFEKEIFIPVIHMTVKNAQGARILENCVGVRDLLMFICSSKNDEMRLSQQFQRINTTTMQRVERNVDDPMPPNLKNFGFQCFASDLFTAPDIIKQYLCAVVRLHRTLVGTRETAAKFDEVANALAGTEMGVFFTDTQRTQIIVSRYSGEKLVQNSEIRDSRFLHLLTKKLPTLNEYSAEKSRLEAEEADLKLREEELQKAKNEFEVKKTGIRGKMSECRDAIRRYNELVASLDFSKENYQKRLEKLPDLDSARRALAELEKKVALETVELTKDGISKLNNILEEANGAYYILWYEQYLLFEEDEYTEQSAIFRTKSHQAKLCYVQAEEEFKNTRQRMAAAREVMRSTCNGLLLTNEDEMDENQVALWRTIQKDFAVYGVPDNMDEVRHELKKERAKQNLAGADGSQEDVDQAEELMKNLEKLRTQYQIQRENRDSWKTNMEKALREWREPIEKLVENINKNFVKFFSELGCIGEVKLDVPEDELNIPAYGIDIMVAFRKTDRVKRLDHQVQSGGERSVSTMLYLLALQELCPVPFRCVDEINQGMDPTNERKVFDMMVRKLSGTGNLAKTQYFLLTPKLLHGLNINEKVTVLAVHNGTNLAQSGHTFCHADLLRKLQARLQLSAA